jgi:hypothetical protein
MDHRESRTQSDYTLAFKLSVARQVEKGELTYKQAQRCYGIQGRSTVLTWLRKHGSQDWSRLGAFPQAPYVTGMPSTGQYSIQLCPRNWSTPVFEKIFSIPAILTIYVAWSAGL